MENIKKLFSNEEIRDLIIVILGVSLILSTPDFTSNLFVYLPIVGLSLFFRNLFNKKVANKLQCTTSFKLWPIGAFLGLISIFIKPVFGIVFLALGYIEITPYKFGRWGIKLIRMTPRDYAYISLSGIGLNLFLLIFCGIFYSINQLEIFRIIGLVNGLLAFFNLLPIPPLEGSHIFTWSFWTWATLLFFNILILVTVII